jgi:hypothetical protein
MDAFYDQGGRGAWAAECALSTAQAAPVTFVELGWAHV